MRGLKETLKTKIMKTIDATLINKDREIAEKGIRAETNSLRDLLLDELKSMYWVEKELTAAIPKMIAGATSETLKSRLASHLEETREHVKRIDTIFNQELDVAPEAQECSAVAGMIKDAEMMMERSLEGSVRDAAIIAAAKKVEHFEIAAYARCS